MKMKVHYINIVLFALPLNILVHNQRNHKKNTLRTPITKATKTHRSLCECELYALSNYENDPEMNEVMENFNLQTSERFREYDERLQDKKTQCKKQCEKDIQKIILKDKIEKQMTQQFLALEANIDTNDIPTCVCENSVADKTGKVCLKCSYGLGSSAPSVGLFGALAVNEWKTGALLAAQEAAISEGAAAGKAAGEAAGVAKTIAGLKSTFSLDTIAGQTLEDLVTKTTYFNTKLLSKPYHIQYQFMCVGQNADFDKPLCAFNTKFDTSFALKAIDANVETVVKSAMKTASDTTAEVTTTQTSALEATKMGAVKATTTTYYTAIIASIVAILIIVLVMAIIYLILRYRRKKKLKRKLQYIKLLKE